MKQVHIQELLAEAKRKITAAANELYAINLYFLALQPKVLLIDAELCLSPYIQAKKQVALPKSVVFDPNLKGNRLCYQNQYVSLHEIYKSIKKTTYDSLFQNPIEERDCH